jgi:hypothetical protein
MKSEHRHELKTNELADWLVHFPEWAKENRTTLIVTGAVILVVLCVYVMRLYRGGSATIRSEVQLTTLVSRLSEEKAKAAQSAQQYLGFVQTAADLEDFASRAPTRQMAAFALIKRGEALRAELHYASSPLTRDDMLKQMEQAKDSYTQALQKAASVPALAASAQFGLGLCEEELGNFDKAREIYTEVAAKAEYSGTCAAAAAADRVKTVDDYRTTVTFKAAPKPKPATASTPSIQIPPAEMNVPMVIPTPNNVAVPPTIPQTTAESNSVSQPNAVAPSTTAGSAEANQPTGGSNTAQ